MKNSRAPNPRWRGWPGLKASFDGIADYDLGGMTFRKLIQMKYPDLQWTGRPSRRQ